jgi:hypothetical protein
MKTYSEFIKVIQEKIGDFGATPKYKKPKENCFGRKQYYAMLDKEVCAFKRKREE